MRHCVQRSIANSIFKQIARLLAVVLAVGIGFGILLLLYSSADGCDGETLID